jgi:hypothetical protein
MNLYRRQLPLHCHTQPYAIVRYEICFVCCANYADGLAGQQKLGRQKRAVRGTQDQYSVRGCHSEAPMQANAVKWPFWSPIDKQGFKVHAAHFTLSHGSKH